MDECVCDVQFNRMVYIEAIHLVISAGTLLATQSHYELSSPSCANVLRQRNHMHPMWNGTHHDASAQSHAKKSQRITSCKIYEKREKEWSKNKERERVLKLYVTGILNAYSYRAMKMHLPESNHHVYAVCLCVCYKSSL